jgi:hypothetical protein
MIQILAIDMASDMEVLNGALGRLSWHVFASRVANPTACCRDRVVAIGNKKGRRCRPSRFRCDG